MFRIIFVMDLLDQMVVHGVKGDRKRYKPIHHFSKIIDESDPIELIKKLSPKEVYIADLNRLMGSFENSVNWVLIKSISASCKTMLDYGVKNMKDIEHAANISSNVILGTETASLDLIERASVFNISISVDIKNGLVLSQKKSIESNPIELIKKLNDYDLQNLIILNMDAVGTKLGIDIKFLSNVSKISKHKLILGGGIKSLEDLKMLKEIGFDGALVATAIHDKSIPSTLLNTKDIAEFL